MGVCYSYILYDEFDWSYLNTSKDKQIESLMECGADVVAQWPYFIVVTKEKTPFYAFGCSVVADEVYEIADNGKPIIYTGKMPKQETRHGN